MSEKMEEMQALSEVAFVQWSMRTSRPTEPNCPCCQRPESRCACGYIQFRTMMEWMDAMR